ncbi:hypothetical protein [Paenibacillus sp. BK720]|nr:hypothetical protein [Paenibacillus sp. BK720]
MNWIFDPMRYRKHHNPHCHAGDFGKKYIPLIGYGSHRKHETN